MKTLPLILISLFMTLSAHSEPAPTVKHLDPAAAAKLLTTKDKPTVLDVRTAEEFAEGHLADAKNIDFMKSSFTEEVAKLDKKQPYLVHCKSGGRSAKTLAVFKKLGFENIYHLDGGIMAWEKAKQKVVK